MEPYDALAVKVAEQCETATLVHVYRSWEEVREALLGEAPLPYNVLWAGSWLFLAVGVYEVRRVVLPSFVLLLTTTRTRSSSQRTSVLFLTRRWRL